MKILRQSTSLFLFYIPLYQGKQVHIPYVPGCFRPISLVYLLHCFLVLKHLDNFGAPPPCTAPHHLLSFPADAGDPAKLHPKINIATEKERIIWALWILKNFNWKKIFCHLSYLESKSPVNQFYSIGGFILMQKIHIKLNFQNAYSLFSMNWSNRKPSIKKHSMTLQ